MKDIIAHFRTQRDQKSGKKKPKFIFKFQTDVTREPQGFFDF